MEGMEADEALSPLLRLKRLCAQTIGSRTW
jgi:hypothetical protein